MFRCSLYNVVVKVFRHMSKQSNYVNSEILKICYVHVGLYRLVTHFMSFLPLSHQRCQSGMQETCASGLRSLGWRSIKRTSKLMR